MYPHPRTYGCCRAIAPPSLSEGPEHPSWAAAPWSEAFVDILGPDHRPQPWLETRFKMLWDDAHLYVAAKLEEPHVWATLTERDSVIFQDNDFEIFFDPDDDHHQYVEIEINALNTVWDLLLPKPYRDGGPAVNEFDIAGLNTQVKVDGTLNDSRDEDHGWSVALAIPWRSLRHVSSRPTPPAVGDRWRFNFSRVQWDVEAKSDGSYAKVPDRPEHNWVWSPQWAVDMHQPEYWGFVEFQEESAPVELDPYWRERCLLMATYANGGESTDSANGLRVLRHDSFWLASVEASDGTLLTLRNDSRLTIVPPSTTSTDRKSS